MYLFHNKDLKMETYQKRIIEEKKELDGRINRLNSFIKSESYNDFDASEQL